LKGSQARLANIKTSIEAMDYYESLARWPGSSTRGHFLATKAYTLDGDVENMPSGMIWAFDENGGRHIFKSLRSILGVIELQAEKISAEKMNGGPYLVQTQYLEVKMEAERSFGGLLMKEYSRSLAHMEHSSPQLNEDTLLNRARSMIEAVNFIHGLGLVHMDIKQQNIFVDTEGYWFLGDFGGCVERGEGVRECTEVLLPRTGQDSNSVLGQPAEWKFDWMMLATVFAEQLDVLENVAVNSKDYIAIEGIRARFAKVQSSILKELLGRMLLCTDEAME
jgi:serine/threonine protein kinase